LRPIALVKEVSDSAIRRLLYEAGDDVDALMQLCKADITSKNNEKVARYLRNFEHVERKMIELEEKDQIRNFQPPVTGEEIMKLFNLPPGRIIGEIKEEIKEAILEGIIKNDHQEAHELLIKIAQRKGLINSEINT
jgi:tRNA nucleotidyltransferase/poly(A) polymerase